MATPILIEDVESHASDWSAIADRIRGSKNVTVLTGAGVSAESGLPTFRACGLWEEYRFEDVATPEAFARDPELVWRFYNYRRAMAMSAQPNDAHRAIAKLESSMTVPFTLITQNVDGLHHAAGSREILELHGNLRRVRCTGCKKTETTEEKLSELPRCECGALLRPDIVWFGEALTAATLLKAQAAAARGGVMLVVGTSAVVHPAAGLIEIGRVRGAFLIEVNPAETEATHLAHAVFRGPASRMVPALVERVTA